MNKQSFHIYFTLSLFISVIGNSYLFAQDKSPIPDATTLAPSLNTMREVYGDKYAKAKASGSPIEKLQALSVIAQEMLSTSQTTQNEIDRYAILQSAERISIESGDIETTISIVESIDKFYDVDLLEMKVEALEKIVSSVQRLDSTDHHNIVIKLFFLTDDAVTLDRYQLASLAAKNALSSANSSRNSDIVKQADDRTKQVSNLAKQYEKVQLASAVLMSKPNDPGANYIVGKYLCLYKKQWSKGLNHLANAGDPSLKKIAELDLNEFSNSDDTNSQIVIGNAWWDIAAPYSDFKTRASYWYQQALPKSSGIDKLKIEKRVAELNMNSLNRGVQAIDLLSQIDLKKHVLSGKWDRNSRSIKCQSSGSKNISKVIEIPVSPSVPYAIEMDVKQSGNSLNGIIMCLVSQNKTGLQVRIAADATSKGPVATANFSATSKGSAKTSTGFLAIRRRVYSAGNIVFSVLDPKGIQRVRYEVRSDRVTLIVNGKQIIDLEGDVNNLDQISRLLGIPLKHPNFLSLAVESSAEFEISRMELFRLPE